MSTSFRFVVCSALRDQTHTLNLITHSAAVCLLVISCNCSLQICIADLWLRYQRWQMCCMLKTHKYPVETHVGNNKLLKQNREKVIWRTTEGSTSHRAWDNIPTSKWGKPAVTYTATRCHRNTVKVYHALTFAKRWMLKFCLKIYIFTFLWECLEEWMDGFSNFSSSFRA